MATKKEKKNIIRQGIIQSACASSQYLAGKISVTNLEFTLGLTRNLGSKKKKDNEFFLPMSLRVEDSSVEKSSDGCIVDFIFSKDASLAKYDTLLVKDHNKDIPSTIKHLLDNSIFDVI